ncbi:glycoside hydrolase [Exidia glandulosa HHB12029]|uniref:mannan endo-1,4-beta-mannosidase n=1 Tax=Exidia glandulosa HHB12029 TaxID=1314781 RepID=A0A166AGT0_EXIGL|nr:glycoside hydrolase [Exidia glandulosa HHB12029]
MRLSALAFALLGARTVSAFASFAGANNYYAYALPSNERFALFQSMNAANMKVLRTFVNGVPAGQKNSDNVAVPDLEPNQIRVYDDTILDMIDELMVEAHAWNIKLLICIYDKNVLQSTGPYRAKYGEEGFYTNPAALDDYNQRITHMLNIHKNAHLNNQAWSFLGAYIFGYSVMNEPMINQGSGFFTQHLDWVCNVAAQIRANVGDRNQLILTGGNSAGTSVQSFFFSASCPAVDVVEIHDYTDGYDGYMQNAINQAKAANKKLIVGEWGSLVGSGRTANLQSNMQKINGWGIPWLYWEFITNPDPHQGEDYEINVVNGTDADYNTIKGFAQAAASSTNGVFDWSGALQL